MSARIYHQERTIADDDGLTGRPCSAVSLPFRTLMCGDFVILTFASQLKLVLAPREYPQAAIQADDFP